MTEVGIFGELLENWKLKIENYREIKEALPLY